MAGVAVAAVASVALVATGGAQDFLSIFQPSQLKAVPVTAADVRSLAGLTSYGTVTGGSSINFEPEPDAAAAAAAADLAVPVVAALPAGTTAAPTYAVVSGGVVTFRFDTGLARAAAARAGGHLPALPAGLDGSTLSVSIQPAVVVSYGVDPAKLLQGGAALPSGPAFIVVSTRTPTVTSTGVTARQLEDYLLSVPGIPVRRRLGAPSHRQPLSHHPRSDSDRSCERLHGDHQRSPRAAHRQLDRAGQRGRVATQWHRGCHRRNTHRQ